MKIHLFLRKRLYFVFCIQVLCIGLDHSTFRYHIKYMFVGDGVKSDAEKIICKLRPALKLRLRFMSHLNIEETSAVASTPSTPSSKTFQSTTAWYTQDLICGGSDGYHCGYKLEVLGSCFHGEELDCPLQLFCLGIQAVLDCRIILEAVLFIVNLVWLMKQKLKCFDRIFYIYIYICLSRIYFLREMFCGW